MDAYLYLLAPLACAVMMVVCMAMMSRGHRRHGDSGRPETSEVAALRAEVAELRAAAEQRREDVDLRR